MFNHGLAVGQVLSEKEVHDVFECQTTLGIRMSKKNNLFVIMSGSANEKRYNDVWDNNVLYYNGTDINSDDSANQSLKTGRGNNNKQLRDVWFTPDEKKPQIFLFVKRERNKCIFKGEAVLCKEPYTQPRHDDPSRSVWIFPLKVVDIDGETNYASFAQAESLASEMNLEELYEKVKGKNKLKQPQGSNRKYTSTSTYYERDPEIAAYAKLRAEGHCDLCHQQAPFYDGNGNPYLEAHHIVWLSKGGADEIDNVVALCPNCHRRIHVVNNPEDTKSLKSRVEYYLTTI